MESCLRRWKHRGVGIYDRLHQIKPVLEEPKRAADLPVRPTPIYIHACLVSRGGTTHSIHWRNPSDAWHGIPPRLQACMLAYDSFLRDRGGACLLAVCRGKVRERQQSPSAPLHL